MSRCPVCNAARRIAFSATAMHKYPFDMASCPDCGLLQIEDPHWFPEAYSEAIAACDTGLVARNLLLAARLRPLFFYLFGTGGRYVDYAGGTGLFVRLMRDAGYDAYWKDEYCANIHARGFEFEAGRRYQAASAFEVLEHLTDPMAFLENVFDETQAEVLFFSTELFSGEPPAPDQWWYYAFDIGQHVSFYQASTLEIMAARLGMRFISHDGMHAFCREAVFGRLKRYGRSALIRRLARMRANRRLRSKTMSDHLLLRGLDTNAFAGGGAGAHAPEDRQRS